MTHLRSRRSAPAVLLLVLLCTAAALGQSDGPDAVLSFSDIDTVSIGIPGRITGLTWMGSDTLAVLTVAPDARSVSGESQVRLVVRGPGGDVLRDADFSGVLARALAWDGEHLWSCGDADDGSSIIYEIEPDTMSVQDAFNTGGHRPTGLCFDGRFLWITDRNSGRIDRFDPEVNEITRSALAPGFSPCGVAWDGRNMWVSDSGSGRLYRLSGSRRNWTGTVDSGSFLYRGRDVLLFHDGVFLWYLAEGNRALTKVRIN